MMIHIRRDSKGMFRFILSILFILAIPIILPSLFSCRISVEGEPYHQGPGPRPAHLSRMEGSWFCNTNNYSGRLEFYWTGNGWTGRIWFEVSARWEELTNIFFDPHTGQVQFIRPSANQQYSGTLSGNRIVGTFGSVGGVGSLPWEAWRP
jgi:hypothetical protein